MCSKMRKVLSTSVLVLLMAAVFVIPLVPMAQAAGSYPSDYSSRVAHYNQHEKPIVDALRTNYQGSLANTIAGRAIWYMEYGYTVYGHSLYAKTGYIDCSQYVSRVYGDFGYTVTGASRKYTTVGTKVSGVYATKLSTGKYTLVGTEKLKVGDIFTFWAKDSNGYKYISHVAMYVGKVNGKPVIINTVKGHPTAIGMVDNFSYWYGSNLYDVRRVLPSSAYVVGGAAINDKGPVIPAVYQMPKGKVVMPKALVKGF
ncbi:MAG: NlpC/P60 family protein [Methylocystaceae bacterium]